MNKKTIITALLALIAMTGQGQVKSGLDLCLRDWAERLDVQSRLLPQEVVFVHMDNNCYFLGDTIYYKVYVTRSDTERLTDMSRVVYTELLDNDGYLIERQILRMEEGQAFGSFCCKSPLL